MKYHRDGEKIEFLRFGVQRNFSVDMDPLSLQDRHFENWLLSYLTSSIINNLQLKQLQ